MALSETDYRELVKLVAAAQARSSTSSFYLRGDEQLQLRTFGSVGSVVLALEGRVFGADGCISDFAAPHTPNSDRTVATTRLPIGEGFLLNAQLRATSGTPRRGQVYAIVEIVRGIGSTVYPVATLFADYVTDTSRVGWPGSSIAGSIDGHGVIRSVTGTNPNAGVEMAETVPTNARWRLLALQISLVTDATVSNRQPTISVTDGVNTLAAWTGTGTQAASLTRVHVSAISGPLMVGVLSFLFHPQPAELVLMGGFQILSNTVNFQAGDNYAAPVLTVEEWIED